MNEIISVKDKFIFCSLFFLFRLECCNFIHLPIRNVSYSVADNSLLGNTDNVITVI